MASSMTGYGRGEAAEQSRRITVEIKTVNNRYCDIQVRMPRALLALEPAVRELAGRRIARGKVDVFVSFEDHSPESAAVACNLPLAQAYVRGIREIAAAADLPDGLDALRIARFPDVMEPELVRVEAADLAGLLQAAQEQALDALCAMRAAEGKRLSADVQERVATIRGLLSQVEQRAPLVVSEYRERLSARVDELLGERSAELFEPQRLAAEVALYADRCAVDEELVRLASHLAQLTALVQLSEPVGKKLDFLVQEINREVNTIGSKANDLTLTQAVVEMKNEVEKIREQIQNLE